MSTPASTTKTLFSRTTSVDIDIQATPDVIWKLLTNAANYPTWNSTVVSIEGTIANGNAIQLKSTLDPKRVFKLKIKECIPNERLVWGDAMGNRAYTLTKMDNGNTHYTMVETIGGPLFPLFAGMIPSFDKNFDQFATDVKKAAENK